ncbi:unnamed protein product [Dracunculus medinensis]|uniref:Uncharacterized protein n=1 Tax=Dracunculus medinensis TaxID=318479 RepID=A0A0N4UNE2_DRAME|nr:unnamed protein product [Dracunculus medinensis]
MFNTPENQKDKLQTSSSSSTSSPPVVAVPLPPDITFFKKAVCIRQPLLSGATDSSQSRFSSSRAAPQLSFSAYPSSSSPPPPPPRSAHTCLSLYNRPKNIDYREQNLATQIHPFVKIPHLHTSLLFQASAIILLPNIIIIVITSYINYR